MIDKLDENIIFLLFILFTVIIVILSWLSTNVREFAFPANLLVIERRSRRLYATTVHGNINRSKVLILKLLKFFSLNKIMLNLVVNAHQLSPSRITTTSTPNALNAEILVSNRSSQIDLVDEMVEQALVDNLLDGTYFTSNNIDLDNNNRQQNNSNIITNDEIINNGPSDSGSGTEDDDLK
jgi:hypothetical protein